MGYPCFQPNVFDRETHTSSSSSSHTYLVNRRSGGYIGILHYDKLTIENEKNNDPPFSFLAAVALHVMVVVHPPFFDF
jgi:hypothetical protein